MTVSTSMAAVGLAIWASASTRTEASVYTKDDPLITEQSMIKYRCASGTWLVLDAREKQPICVVGTRPGIE